jgi:flagellar hook-basal body complex protein FliE
MINPTNAQNIESMLSQIRSYQSEAAQGVNTPPGGVTATNSPEEAGFGNTIKNALQEVNAAQQASKDLRTAYEKGENVPLTDVVIGMQKSSLAFEATLQVRNKVLKAYEEIMNMPV